MCVFFCDCVTSESSTSDRGLAQYDQALGRNTELYKLDKWYIHVVFALGRKTEEDLMFKVILHYIPNLNLTYKK